MQRDIVLIPYPFSDQSRTKIRPGLILSNDKYNARSEDVVICAITSNIIAREYSILVDEKNLEQKGLHTRSAVLANKLLTIKKTLVIKTIARIDKPLFAKVSMKSRELIEENDFFGAFKGVGPFTKEDRMRSKFE
jgi:mRNA interferase MazF